MENILEVQNVEKYYGNKSNLTKAVDNISFNVKKKRICWNNGSIRKWKNNTFKLYINNR